MTKIDVAVWGREMSLDVVFDCYEGESVLPVQERALESLLASWSVVDESLDAVKHYCLEESVEPIDDGAIDDIFEYVVPESLFVRRTENVRTIALMCDSQIDPEHGLAAVFRNEEFSEVGPQDIVL